jgi:hypothetical protein
VSRIEGRHYENVFSENSENQLLSDSDRFFTIRKTAAILGVTPKVVDYWMSVRLLPWVEIDRSSRRVKATDLDRFMRLHANVWRAFRDRDKRGAIAAAAGVK